MSFNDLWLKFAATTPSPPPEERPGRVEPGGGAEEWLALWQRRESIMLTGASECTWGKARSALKDLFFLPLSICILMAGAALIRLLTEGCAIGQACMCECEWLCLRIWFFRPSVVASCWWVVSSRHCHLIQDSTERAKYFPYHSELVNTVQYWSLNQASSSFCSSEVIFN